MTDELCTVDGKPVLVSIYKGSGLCSENCRKAAVATRAADRIERQARADRAREQESLDRCQGGNPPCRRRKPASWPRDKKWLCHDHKYLHATLGIEL